MTQNNPEVPEELEATVVLPSSRRGKVLKVAQVAITFDDGVVEIWKFPVEAPANYREGRNSSGEGKSYTNWKEHSLWWQSDKRVPEESEPKHVEPGTPILDAYGRATGLRT